VTSGGQTDAGDGGGGAGAAGGTDSNVLTIRYEGATESPPDPCDGVEYSAGFVVRDGAPPYALRATQLPAGLQFNADTRTLSGIVATTASVTLEAVDSEGQRGTRTFTLTPRDACWLGYLAGHTTATTLQLYDPVLATHLSFEQLQRADESGSDFEFSPNGRFIAYRIGAADSSYRLVVLQAPEWEARPLAFPGSVTQYAWSKDSSALAVAFAKDADTWLGGARIAASADSGAGGAGGASGADVSFFEPVPAPVESELTWFGTDSLVFNGTDDPDLKDYPELRQLFVTRLTTTGFALPVAGAAIYTAPFVISPAGEGFFLAIPEDHTLGYHGFAGAVGEETTNTLFGSARPDPFGLYAATLSGDQISLFDLTSGSVGTGADNKVPVASAAGCPVLLGWARGAERLACAADTATGGEVRILNLNAAANTLSSDAVKAPYTYSQGLAQGERRLFSPSGDWLAFTTENNLYLANLADGTPYLIRKDAVWPVPAPGSVTLRELEFSPNEQLLLEHRDSHLFIHSVVRPDYTSFQAEGLGAALPSPTPCSEDFVTAPDSFCGAASAPKGFAWSRSSDFVAFLRVDGKLDVLDLRNLYQGSTSVNPVDAQCASNCAFRFQP
jgi:hypothetical protein